MGVEFEEQRVPPSLRMAEAQVGSITAFFLKTGFAKNVRDAQLIMGVLALLMLVLAGFITIRFLAQPQGTPLSPEELRTLLSEPGAAQG